jgi:hypothetical protein
MSKTPDTNKQPDGSTSTASLASVGGQIGAPVTAERSGTGVPTLAGIKGDRYWRTDTLGTVNQRLYVCTTAGAAGAAVWTGIL